MRILFAITFLHFGAGKSLVELACEAKRRGHDPHIVATRKIDQFESQANLVEEAKSGEVPVLLLPDLFTRDLNRVGASAEGINHLVEAVAMLPKEIAGDLELTVVVDGPQKDALMQMTRRLGIEGQVRWMGYQENPYTFMSQFDVFVLSYLTESLPVSLVEAMYLKIPVLATDVQGSREIGGEGRAVLVPARDSRKLAEALQDIYLNRDAARRRAAAAHSWVLDNFDREVCFGKMLDLCGDAAVD